MTDNVEHAEFASPALVLARAGYKTERYWSLLGRRPRGSEPGVSLRFEGDDAVRAPLWHVSQTDLI